MYERVDDRLEQALRAPCVLSDPANELRLHHRRLAHDDEEPPADRELALKALVGDGERGRYGDRVVTLFGVEPSRILRDDVHVPQAEGGDVATGQLRELGKDFERPNGCAACPQTRRHESLAGPDFEHPLAAGARERLEYSADHARPQHVLAARQRDLHVCEGKEAMLRGNESIPRHLAQYLEHPCIEHVPGTHLLLDHLFACLDRRHLDWGSDWTYCIPRGGARELTGFRGCCQAGLRRDLVKRRRDTERLRYASGVRTPGTRIMKAIAACPAAANAMTFKLSARAGGSPPHAGRTH